MPRASKLPFLRFFANFLSKTEGNKSIERNHCLYRRYCTHKRPRGASFFFFWRNIAFFRPEVTSSVMDGRQSLNFCAQCSLICYFLRFSYNSYISEVRCDFHHPKSIPEVAPGTPILHSWYEIVFSLLIHFSTARDRKQRWKKGHQNGISRDSEFRVFLIYEETDVLSPVIFTYLFFQTTN